MSANVAELAARLSKAVADRTAIEQLSDDVPDLDLATGYAVQRAQREAAGPLVGWKLGVTSRAKQAQVGVSSPVYGFLAGANALDLGEPLRTGELIQPRAEPEVVFTLRTDLAGPNVTAADVLAATAGVAVGIEILDSRFRDYRFTMADVVADNTSAGRFVVGTPVPPQGVDLRLVGVVLEHNGDVAATASGAASLGHPAAAVAWLARTLFAEGEGPACRRDSAVRWADRRGAGGSGRRGGGFHRPAGHRRAGLPLTRLPKGGHMPLVQITLARGRTEEQLATLGREVTDAVERSLGARRESIRVVVSECEPEHWFAGGESLAELRAAGKR